MEQTTLLPGQVIEVTTEKLAYGGEAIARYRGFTVFIQGAAPEERLRARVVEKKRNFARAVIEEILVASAARREPACRYFGDCGGCQIQHINYAAQLEAKVEFVRDALRRIGQISWQQPIDIHSAAEFGYRSRAQFKVVQNKEITAIGFYKAASHQICDIEECPILLPQLNQALREIRTQLQENRMPLTSPHVEFEIAATESGIAIEPPMPSTDPQSAAIYPPFSTVARRKTNDFIYEFSPSSFFQVNDLLLDDFVRAVTETEKGDLALDLYAGVGLFTLPLSRNFHRVVAVESHARAVEFARQNLKINRVENVEFQQRYVAAWLQDFLRSPKQMKPDLILLDPPRSGAADAVELIKQAQPRQITYVSCDPATLARDLRSFVSDDYNLTRVVAFDLFPQTYHVETIVSLERQS